MGAIWDAPVDVMTACYEDLRRLASAAVVDDTVPISPIAVFEIASAGEALGDEDYVIALRHLLAAVGRLAHTHGLTAKGQALAAEATEVGHRLLDDMPLLAIHELIRFLFLNPEARARLGRWRTLYREQLGEVVTAAVLHAVMPRLSGADVAHLLGPLNAALVEFDIITPRRWTAFLAESAEESIQLTSMTELPSAFASSASKFKGRGAMQLTGRTNYRAAGKALGFDLEHHPEWVASDADIGFRAAGWFWKRNGLNERADNVHSLADFDKIGNVINRGGPSKKALGTKEREAFYKKATRAWVDYKNRCCAALTSGTATAL
jgi:predicted chitinase